MNDFGAVQANTLPSTQPWNTLDSSGDTSSTLDAVDQLMAEHGADNVSGAYQNLTLAEFIAALKAAIASNPSLSEAIKEVAYARIDAAGEGVQADTTPDAMEAVEALAGESWISGIAQMLEDIMMSLAAQNDEENGAGSTEGKKSKAQGGAEASAGAEGAAEGGGTGNWLERLAVGLAEVQAKWLAKADMHLDEMNAAAGVEAPAADQEGSGTKEGTATQEAKKAAPDSTGADTEAEANTKAEADTKAFTTAQSKYSAAMQMFSMTAAATSTSIKSVGEGLAGIARKQ